MLSARGHFILKKNYATFFWFWNLGAAKAPAALTEGSNQQGLNFAFK